MQLKQQYVKSNSDAPLAIQKKLVVTELKQ